MAGPSKIKTLKTSLVVDDEESDEQFQIFRRVMRRLQEKSNKLDIQLQKSLKSTEKSQLIAKKLSEHLMKDVYFGDEHSEKSYENLAGLKDRTRKCLKAIELNTHKSLELSRQKAQVESDIKTMQQNLSSLIAAKASRRIQHVQSIASDLVAIEKKIHTGIEKSIQTEEEKEHEKPHKRKHVRIAEYKNDINEITDDEEYGISLQTQNPAPDITLTYRLFELMSDRFDSIEDEGNRFKQMYVELNQTKDEMDRLQAENELLHVKLNCLQGKIHSKENHRKCRHQTHRHQN